MRSGFSGRSAAPGGVLVFPDELQIDKVPDPGCSAALVCPSVGVQFLGNLALQRHQQSFECRLSANDVGRNAEAMRTSSQLRLNSRAKRGGRRMVTHGQLPPEWLA